jgi:Xaa-Pro aminopeptidase
VDGSIGEGSPFHQTFGYYAHGVGEDTAVLREGWRGRLVPLHNENTGHGTGLCLEVHDLAVSKLVAGREKDLVFLRGLFKHGLANPTTVVHPRGVGFAQNWKVIQNHEIRM